MSSGEQWHCHHSHPRTYAFPSKEIHINNSGNSCCCIGRTFRQSNVRHIEYWTLVFPGALISGVGHPHCGGSILQQVPISSTKKYLSSTPQPVGHMILNSQNEFWIPSFTTLRIAPLVAQNSHFLFYYITRPMRMSESPNLDRRSPTRLVCQLRGESRS